MNRSILVVGGSSFLGVALLDELYRQEDLSIGATFSSETTATPFTASMFQRNIQHHILNLVLDEQERVDEIVSKYDIIINCTGQISNPISLCFDLNTKGIKKVALAIKKFNKKLLQISTVGVYGSADRVDESAPIKPETTYSISKAFAEFLITDILPEEQYCIVRLSNLYGKNQQKGVLSYLLRSFESDRKLFFNNNGDLIRYYLEINDCAKILVSLMHAEGKGIFNLCGNDKYTILELIELFEKKLNTKYQVLLEPIKPYDNINEISYDKINKQIHLTYDYSIGHFLTDKVNAFSGNIN